MKATLIIDDVDFNERVLLKAEEVNTLIGQFSNRTGYFNYCIDLLTVQ